MALTRTLVCKSFILGLVLTVWPTLAQAAKCPPGHAKKDPVSGVRVCETKATSGKKTSRDVAYMFSDDPLSGGSMGTTAAKIVVRSPGIRRTLIRPRLNFVPELLKSVEKL